MSSGGFFTPRTPTPKNANSFRKAAHRLTRAARRRRYVVWKAAVVLVYYGVGALYFCLNEVGDGAECPSIVVACVCSGRGDAAHEECRRAPNDARTPPHLMS